MKITAITIPYFGLMGRPPASDRLPLSPSGIFNFSAKGAQYICEQKFSVSWSGGSKSGEPSLVVLLNPLSEYQARPGNTMEQPPAVQWVRDNLFWITVKWEKVLDLLDEETTLPVW